MAVWEHLLGSGRSSEGKRSPEHRSKQVEGLCQFGLEKGDRKKGKKILLSELELRKWAGLV